MFDRMYVIRLEVPCENKWCENGTHHCVFCQQSKNILKLCLKNMIHSQSVDKKQKLFKDSLQFQESASGISIMKIPSAYLLRILKPLLSARDAAPTEHAASRIRAMDHCPDVDDPLIHAIYSMESTFSTARTKGVDVLSSAEGIASEHIIDKGKGNGCLLLAWKSSYNSATRRIDDPVLVGAMTVYKFKRSPNFSTDASSTGVDDATLDPFFRSNFIYIDTLVSTGAGAGKLLALHAYRYAIMKKARGVIALSYSKRRLTGTAKPESYKIFDDLGFLHLIENATYNIQMYGTWFVAELKDITMAGVLESGIRLCTRNGFTSKTEDQLVWRCPR